MHFRILLGGHYHLVYLKLHGGAVLVLLGVVLVLDKAAFHGAVTLTVKDVVDQVGKALVVAFAGARLLHDLLFLTVHIVLVLAVGLGAVAGRSLLFNRSAGRLGTNRHAALGLGGRRADADGRKDGLDGGLVLAHHLAFLRLNQLGDHQVVAAKIFCAVNLLVGGGIGADVGVPGHVAVGRQVRLVQVDLVVACASLILVLADLNDLCIRISCLIFCQGSLCSPSSGRIILIGVVLVSKEVSATRRCLIGIALFAVSHGAGDLVEGAGLGMVVVVAAFVLEVTLLLARCLVVADLVVQTHIVVLVLLLQHALVCQQIFGAVVPLQLRVHQHAVRGFRLAVLAGQQVQLGIGSKIQMTDVVTLCSAKEATIGSIRMIEISLAGVVVIQGFLKAGAFIDRDLGFLCQLLLGVQSGDELLGGHVRMSDSGLEVGDDIFLDGRFSDLDVTDPKLFALAECYITLLLDVIPKLLIRLVQRTLDPGVHSFLHGLVHRLVDGQGGLLQFAVVDGNGGLAIGIGGGLAALIQGDPACVNTELLGEHIRDGGFVREFLVRQGDGVGGGRLVIAVLFGAGVLSVRTLGVLLAVNGKDGIVLAAERKVIAALSNKHLVEGFGILLRVLGFLGDGPLCLGNIALKADVLVALSNQFFLGLAGVLLAQGFPCKGFLFGVGQGAVGNGVGGSDLVIVLVCGDHVKANKATLLILTHSAFRQSRYARAGVAGDLLVRTGPRCIGPADLAVGDQSRTGDGVLLDVGLARFIGQNGDLRRILRGGGVGVGQGVGLAIISSSEGVVGGVERADIQCLQRFGFVESHFHQGVLHRIVGSVHLGLVLGGFLAGSLGLGVLLGLGNADVNGQVPAKRGFLRYVQLYPFAVVGTVIDIFALSRVAVAVQFVVQFVNDFFVGQLIGAGGVDLYGVLPDGAILGSLLVGVLAVLYAVGILAARFL